MINKELEVKIFEQMLEDFLRNWLPQEPYGAMLFERDFHMLVRQIYRDAQAPLLERITILASAIPMFHVNPLNTGPILPKYDDGVAIDPSGRGRV